MRTPIVMLADTSRVWEKVGEPVRADSYFGSTDGVHTVSVHYSNFVGAFALQGTLSLTPTEDDWFDIALSNISCPGTTSYVKYPKNDFNPSGVNGDSGTDAFTFVGNFTFLRASLVRSYLGDAPDNNVVKDSHGSIDRVLLSL